MADLSRPVGGQEENLLEAALDTAFSAAPTLRQPVQPQAQPSDIKQPPSPNTSAEEGSISHPSTDDQWKAEYVTQVQSWRVRSAEARARAEIERARWEAIRIAEKEDAVRRKAEGIVDEPLPGEAEWETIGKKKSLQQTVVSSPLSPSPTDPRDPVSEEPAEKHVRNTGSLTVHHASYSQQDTGDGSQKWEDVHASLTSSFPSISFPERTETPSPSRNQPPPPLPPVSATLAIFDSSLSTRTRALALFSSLAINVLLPFVNGVMLGFGEIFAKNVVLGWFGWRASTPAPKSVVTTAGIGVRLPSVPAKHI